MLLRPIGSIMRRGGQQGKRKWGGSSGGQRGRGRGRGGRTFSDSKYQRQQIVGTMALPDSVTLPETTGRRITEADVGILSFVSAATPGFRGITKQRLTDFIVQEIDPRGAVAALTNTSLPEKVLVEDERKGVSEEALLVQLEAIVGVDQIALFRTFLADQEQEDFSFTVDLQDKAARTSVHGIIRNLPMALSSKSFQEGDASFIQVKRGAERRGGFNKRPSWPWPGKYVRFVLSKMNLDTMSCINQLARATRTQTKIWAFAGTKDKRGVTSQFVTVNRMEPNRVLGAVQQLTDVHAGNFSFSDEPLRLGELSGNRFTIVLRFVDGSPETVANAAKTLQTHGFINYYGMQRFGSGSPTHLTGLAFIKQQWGAGIGAILSARPHDKEVVREERKKLFESRDIVACLETMPQWLSVERGLLTALSTENTNLVGAVQRIPRNMRKLYVHAWQSFAWNHMASLRMAKMDPHRPVVGDLVLPPRELDDSTVKTDRNAKVHIVTEEDVKEERFSMWDVVLPLPGHGILFPENEMKEAYMAFMETSGVSMGMLSNSPIDDFRLAGDYRSVVTLPTDIEWRLVKYASEEDQLTRTDWELLQGQEPVQDRIDGDKTAMILSFNLGTSSYATMCLRELTKEASDIESQKKLNIASVNE